MRQDFYYEGKRTFNEETKKEELAVVEYSYGVNPRQKYLNIQFCIECDKLTVFNSWLCSVCGCFSPQGDPSDENIEEDGIDPIENPID